jgi:hypothetical protein
MGVNYAVWVVSFMVVLPRKNCKKLNPLWGESGLFVKVWGKLVRENSQMKNDFFLVKNKRQKKFPIFSSFEI